MIIISTYKELKLNFKFKFGKFAVHVYYIEINTEIYTTNLQNKGSCVIGYNLFQSMGNIRSHLSG